MSNKRVSVKALQRGPWVFMVGDLVKSTLVSFGGAVLQPGEVAKVIRTYYIETPIVDPLDPSGVVREGWVDLEIVKPSVGVPAAEGLRMSDEVSNILPADYKVGAGIGNGGRSFDRFVEQYVISPSRARVG